MKTTNKNRNNGTAYGICIGVAIGTSLGSAFNNIAIGIPIGICIGMAIGYLLGERKDREVNKQIEEKGYTIRAVEATEDKEYAITIVNKFGEEQIIKVPEGVMSEESLEIGDIVFLDDDGLIEQAYDKDDT